MTHAQLNIQTSQYAATNANIVHYEADDPGCPEFDLLRVTFEQPVGWHDYDRPMELTSPALTLAIFDPTAFFAAIDAARENFARRHEPPENGGPVPGAPPAGTAWAG